MKIKLNINNFAYILCLSFTIFDQFIRHEIEYLDAKGKVTKDEDNLLIRSGRKTYYDDTNECTYGLG
jgi:hypothetical protein